MRLIEAKKRVLPSPSLNINYSLKLEKSTKNILDIFGNTTYSMELKMRWEAIKKITKYTPITLSQ
jgi:hypothetical protein